MRISYRSSRSSLLFLDFYARQLCRQVLLRARISFGNSVRLSVCLSVRHDPVRIHSRPGEIETPGLHHMIAEPKKLKIPTAHILSSPSSLFPFPPSFLPLPLLRSRAPQIQVGCLGSTISSPTAVWGEAQPKYLVATTVKIFLRVD